jgi:hypothetical protein
MNPSRVAGHIRTHNWFAVLVEFAIVVAGVFVGLQVSDWHEAREKAERTAKIVEAVREDLKDAIEVETTFGGGIDASLAAFDAARQRGEHPLPVFLRFPGSDTAPGNVWQAVLQSQLADLIDPKLLFELGFYYDERAGLGVKFVRYTQFTESEILPRLKQASETFYTPDGARLAPVFEAHMDRLRERQREVAVLNAWARCLDKRLESPQRPGPSCRPPLGYGIEMPGVPAAIDD